MKKIFKLFPVVLAVVALASCSSDDLLGVNGENAQLNPDYLYVTIDDDDATTRAAYVSANVLDKQQANGNDFFRTLFWTGSDKIKLYSEKNNWRTQTWGFDAAATDAQPQYKKNAGFSVFTVKEDVYSADGTTYDAQYKDGYGVMPADLSEFTNESRTKLKFDLRGLKYTKFEQTLVEKPASPDGTSTDAVNAYYGNGALNVYKSTAPLPLWGVATSANGITEMKCKWLTGHLCVDLVKKDGNIIPAAEPEYNNYLVIQSNQSLWGVFESIDFEPNYTKKNIKAAAPIVPAIAATATTITPGTTTIGDLNEDCIVLNLGSAAMTRVIAYAPIMVSDAATTVTATLYKGKAPASETEADINAVVLETLVSDFKDPYSFAEGAKMTSDNIEAGKLYRVANPDYCQIETANTPYSLQTQLAAVDATMERDYVVEVKNDVLVKTANTKYEDMATSVADQHNYVLDLSGVDFKHNVTIKFSGSYGFTNNEVNATDVNYLYVKTKAGKSVTIDLPNVTKNIKAVVVDDNLGGELILKGNGFETAEVINYGTATANGKLTVAAAAKKISTSGAMTIDAPEATITDLVLLNNKYNGADGAADYTVSLNNGKVATLSISPAATIVSGQKSLLKNNVTIASTGLSSITNAPAPSTKANESDANTQGIQWVKNNTSSVYYPQKGIYYTSVWDGSKYTNETAASLSDDGKIYTAAQLASIEGATGYKLMTKTMTLSDQEWAPVALTKAFAGADVEGAVYTNTTKKTTTYPVIDGLTITKTQAATYGTGFFSTVSNVGVENLKFSGASITATNTGTTNFENIGIVAGRVLATTSDVTWKNITVTNSSINTANAPMNDGLYDAIGAVIGYAGTASNVLNLNNVDVATVTITGYKYLGGLIGYLSGKGVIGEAFNKADSECNISGLAFNFTERSTAYVYDFAYKTVGAYVGYAANSVAGDLKVIYDKDNMPNYTTSGTSVKSFSAGTALFELGKWGILEGTVTNYYDILFPQTMIGFSSFNPATSEYAARTANFNYYGGSTTTAAEKTSSLGKPAVTTFDGPTMYYINK